MAVSNNTAVLGSGGINSDNGTTLFINDSTVSGNTADGFGAGLNSDPFPRNMPAADQRKASRIGAVDIGAVEVNSSQNGGSFIADLPNGSQNLSYNFTLVPNNGAFTYSVTSGALPNGVNLTTSLSPNIVVALDGTPTQAGIFNFAVTATDGANTNVTNYKIEILAPTSVGVLVSGRVLTNDGRGLMNAIVTMTDTSGNVRSYRISSFGYFSFEDVEVGQTYVFQVQSKRFSFAPQVVTISDDLTDLTFVSSNSF